MNEPFELGKALELVVRSSTREEQNELHRNAYSTLPSGAYGEDNGREGDLHLQDY